jgi:hypothetical protein
MLEIYPGKRDEEVILIEYIYMYLSIAINRFLTLLDDSSTQKPNEGY